MYFRGQKNIFNPIPYINVPNVNSIHRIIRTILIHIFKSYSAIQMIIYF